MRLSSTFIFLLILGKITFFLIGHLNVYLDKYFLKCHEGYAAKAACI